MFQVVSGGRWEAGPRRGSYRAIVELIGYEHVSCRLWIEWLTDVQQDQSSDVAARVLVEEISGGLWSCLIDSQQQPFAGDKLIVTATQTHTLANRTFEVAVSGPGEYSVEE